MADINNKFNSLFIQINKDLLKEVEKCVSHKNNLTGIALEDLPNEDKITKFRQTILKFNHTTNLNVSPVTLEQKDEIMNLGKLMSQDDWRHAMKLFGSIVEKYTDTLEPFQIRFDKIAQVLRNTDLSDKLKIDQISDLLL